MTTYSHFGVPYSRIVYADFKSWADWCVSKGYTVNLYADSVFSLRRALDMVGLNGRGTVVQRGSKFSCIVDRPEVLPVQRFLFTAGNIIKDSFTEEWLPMDSRANAIEVTYFDADIDYSRQTVTLYAGDFDTSDREINTTQVTLYGCTSRALATAYGQFLLNCNQWLTLTGSWEADVDALACVTGDVIEAAHDVPQWGESGRVIEGGSGYVFVDRVLTYDSAKTYQITIKHTDDTRETKTATVTSVASGFIGDPASDGFIGDPDEDGFLSSADTVVGPVGVIGWSYVEIVGDWDQTPAKYDLYSFGEANRISKKMRIVRISRSQEMRRKLVCIEHVDEVYEALGAVMMEDIGAPVVVAANLRAIEEWRGGSVSNVNLSWTGRAASWHIFWKRSTGGVWQLAGKAYGGAYTVRNMDYNAEYVFSVSSTVNPEEGAQITLTLGGKTTLPGDVATLTITEILGVLTLAWAEVTDFDVDYYEIRRGASWAGGVVVDRTKSLTLVAVGQPFGSQTYRVKAVDSFGNASATEATATITIAGGSTNLSAFHPGTDLTSAETSYSVSSLVYQATVYLGNGLATLTVPALIRATVGGTCYAKVGVSNDVPFSAVYSSEETSVSVIDEAKTFVVDISSFSGNAVVSVFLHTDNASYPAYYSEDPGSPPTVA